MADTWERVILVTGGAGFIASHVVILLVTKYPTYKIVNLDKLDYCSSLKNLESIQDKPNYTFVKGNILDTDLINYVVRAEHVDTIMHFAAQTHVGEFPNACRSISFHIDPQTTPSGTP